MNKPRIKSIFFITIIIFIILSISGCIHIDFGDPLRSEKPKPPEYHIVTKPGFPLKHVFDINDQWNPIESKETQPFIIKHKTEWFNISIEVVINTFNFINDSPLENYSFIDQFVHVTILDPDKEKYYDKEFFETDEVKRQLSTPKSGDWVVLVDAVGLGYGDIHDSYNINVIANEPI